MILLIRSASENPSLAIDRGAVKVQADLGLGTARSSSETPIPEMNQMKPRIITLHRIRVSSLIALTGFLLCSTGIAADDEATKILDRYVEAVGGKSRLDQIKSVVIKGTFSLPDMGMYAPLETYTVVPDKSFTKIDIGDFGTAMNGVNGDVVWDINPMVGPRLLTGGERLNRLRQAQVDPFANWKENFTKAEMVGKETVGEVECSKVTFTPAEGEPMTGFFSNETGLMVKMVGSQGGQSVETSMKDYRDVNGIKVAHLVDIYTPQMSFTIELETIEYNGEIPDEKFALPPEIQALVDRQ